MDSKNAGAPMRAAVYTRISRDKESDEAGVTRQREDALRLAERLGYTVAEDDIFSDNDISASTKSTKPRPRYDEMMRQARAGKYKAILAYSNSRLTRRPREFEDLIDLYEKHGVQFHTVASGSFDLATADGRRMARFLAGEATAEAERTGERVARAKQQAAESGKYRGGQRPYGYEKDGIRIREKEAAIIREASAAVLAGRTLAAVARVLNDRGLKTATGKPWTYQRLKDVLVRPRNAGLLSHGDPSRPEGDQYRLTFEVVGKANWEPIIDEDTWRAIVTTLTDPTRRHQNGNDLRWLLSGILKCGICGTPMRPAPYGGTSTKKGAHRTRRYLYRCTAAAHLTISARQSDDWVRDYVAQAVRDPLVSAAMNSEKADELAADRIRRAELEVSLAQTERDYDDDLIDARRYAAKRDKINAEIAEIDDRIAAGLAHTAAAEVFGAADPGAAFEAAPLDIQRAVISAMITARALPAARRGAPWSKERLEITDLV